MTGSAPNQKMEEEKAARLSTVGSDVVFLMSRLPAIAVCHNALAVPHSEQGCCIYLCGGAHVVGLPAKVVLTIAAGQSREAGEVSQHQYLHCRKIDADGQQNEQTGAKGKKDTYIFLVS